MFAMNNKMLYYSKNNLQDLEYILKQAAIHNFKLMIATKTDSFFAKQKLTKIIVYNNLEIKDIKRLISLMGKSNKIYTSVDNLEHTLKTYNLKCKYFADLKSDIAVFLDHLNLQPLSSSNIIIKHCLFVMVEKNINKCSFSILKQICDWLHLDWKQEKTPLRNNLKEWATENEISGCDDENFTFNILNTINEIYTMYVSNPHKHIDKNNYTIGEQIWEFIYKGA